MWGFLWRSSWFLETSRLARELFLLLALHDQAPPLGALTVPAVELRQRLGTHGGGLKGALEELMKANAVRVTWDIRLGADGVPPRTGSLSIGATTAST